MSHCTDAWEFHEPSRSLEWCTRDRIVATDTSLSPVAPKETVNDLIFIQIQ